MIKGLGLIVLGMLGYLWKGYVIFLVWTWYIMPISEYVPYISGFTFAVLCSLQMMFHYEARPSDEEIEELVDLEWVIDKGLDMITYPLIVLTFSAVLHHFF